MFLHSFRSISNSFKGYKGKEGERRGPRDDRYRIDSGMAARWIKNIPRDDRQYFCQYYSSSNHNYKNKQSQYHYHLILLILNIKEMLKNIGVKVDFSGGLDLVFDGKTQIDLELPELSNISAVVAELCAKHANHKKEMFAINGVIRAGILVLVNDSDWQLLQKEETVLQQKDRVSFISTLHGG